MTHTIKQNKKADPRYVAQVILARRDHTETEMRTKLARKNFSKHAIEDTIVWLKQKRLINDREFVYSYIENILSAKIVGPRWLRFKLKQKGVPSLLIDEVLVDAYPVDRQKILASQAAQQWKNIHLKHSEDKVRLMRFLMSRGFSPDVF